MHPDARLSLLAADWNRVYTLTPSLTALLPTAPRVLFANLHFQHNLAPTLPVQNRAGSQATRVNLRPRESPAVTNDPMEYAFCV